MKKAKRKPVKKKLHHNAELNQPEERFAFSVRMPREVAQFYIDVAEQAFVSVDTVVNVVLAIHTCKAAVEMKPYPKRNV